MTDLTHPAAVTQKLAEIEQDMAVRQNAYESAARNWVHASRNQKKSRAVAFRLAKAETTVVAERNAIADEQTALDGDEEEAEYSAIRVVMDTLSKRASINQSILKSQQQGGFR